MADAIVSVVLEQLLSIISKEIQQEVRLVVGVRKEIQKLTDNFQAIQAVLVDAEQRRVKETAVRVWLDKLKAVSYDMDDVLDEWNTAILKLQIEGVENARIPKKKVCFRFSSPCFCLRQVALRHDLGLKIKEINENVDAIALEKDRYNLNVIRSIEEPQRSKTTSFIEVSEIRGRDKEKDNLVNKLLNESYGKKIGIHVISIVGMSGIGKTTLAQLAYNDEKVVSNFDKRIWVCVSDPFDELRIAKAIIEGFRGETPNLGEFQSHLDCIHETIMNKKFLLILDDVWTEEHDKWGSLYNSLNYGLHCGSKIIVTTRKENVASMMKSIEVINIEQLSIDESWLLFKQFAFYDKSQEESERLEDIGRKIVAKCQGLPLAIKTMGSLLRFKKTRDQWQRILDSEMWELEESEKGLFPPLLLSYNDLSSMAKRCFSYCAIFPKDYEIFKDNLIELWMAQGYLGLNQEKDLEGIGEDVFDTLAMYSLFQEFNKFDDGGIYSCKMHDIVHDFAQYLDKNECFTKEINENEEASPIVSCENARHSMVLKNSSICHVNLRSVGKLRSLLVRSDHTSTGNFLPNLFEQLTCVRALKFSRSWDGNIPSEIEKLIHLRYLDISFLDDIKELPETLCCLYNLQTLNLSDCVALEKLPEGIGKLIKLRHLINDWTPRLKYMPKGIERLVCLRRIDDFVVGVDAHGKGKGTLECLKNLNKLRGDLELRGLENVVDEAEAKNAQLMNKKNLIDLSLIFYYTSKDEEYMNEIEERRRDSAAHTNEIERCMKDSAILEALQPPPTLESLFIDYNGSMALSPRWMVSLTHLNSLTLRSCTNWEYLPPLGKLPLLRSLNILGLTSVKRVSNEFVGMETSSSSSTSVVAFPKLKTLSFHMENLEDWEYQITEDITIMPSLSSLRIYDCPKLKSLPDHLLRTTSLKSISLNNCRSLEYLPPLGKLPLLQSLHIERLVSVKRVSNEFVGMETSSSSSPSVIAFPKLNTLTFSGMDWEDWEDHITGDFTIMSSLSSLIIASFPKLKSLPDHLFHATSLKSISLDNCRSLEYLPPLGKLPLLRSLVIEALTSVKRVSNEFVGMETASSSSPSVVAFPKLDTLYFRLMENWDDWEYQITGYITIMPSLSSLEISNCPNLKSLPNHLLYATSLKHLVIRGCPILKKQYSSFVSNVR